MRVVTGDGWTLDVQVHEAAGRRRGAVLLLHAMMADRRSFDRPAGAGVAATLASRGFDVFLADFRGHGASRPLASEGGSWHYDDLVHRDVPALVAAVRDASPSGPLFVVGHSLGGHVTSATVGTGGAPEVDGLGLLATNVWMPSLEPSRARRLAKAASLRFFSGTARRAGRFPARRLRVGPADEPLPYVLDLHRFWLEDRWGDAEGRVDYLAALDRVKVPVLALAARGDRLMGHPAGARAWTGRLGSQEVDFRVVGGADLGGFSPGHMGLVTDARARPAWEHLADWLSRVR